MDAPGLSPAGLRVGLRIGLSGGIGSGKSSVAALLVEHGAVLVDTDLIARQLTLPGGAAIEPITQAFGSALIDAAGALDRERMRELVFADASAKQRLEAILHPLIGIETQRQAAAAGTAITVLDVPLLVETGHWRARVDKVLIVDCCEATQIERVAKRSGWAPHAVQRVIDSQAPRRLRRACADAVIYNDGINPVQLADTVRSLWQGWIGSPG